MYVGATIEDKQVIAEDFSIHYLTAGATGSPILLLHGGGVDAASFSWKLCISLLAQHCRTFAVDLPGYGHNDKPDIAYTTEYYGSFLGSLLDALDLDETRLVGLSLGGLISLGFTLQSPHRVDKLVLVDSAGLGGDIPWRIVSYAMIRLPLVNEVMYLIYRTSRRMMWWGLSNGFYDPHTITEELLDEVSELAREPGAGRAFRSWQRSDVRWSGLRTNYVDSLHDIAVLTLIVHSAEDKSVPVVWDKRAHELIKGSELSIIPKCGHVPPRERPEEFNRMVLDFLVKNLGE